MVTAIEPQDVGSDTDAYEMESAAQSESSSASEIPPPIDSPDDSSDAMSMVTPDDDDVNVGGIGLDDDDAEATGASDSAISPDDDMPDVDPEPFLDIPSTDSDDVDEDDQNAGDDAPLDLGLDNDDTGFGSGGLKSTDDDDSIKNALADYGDEKSRAKENSAVKSDKSMEYRGTPQEPTYKARGGRGKIRF